MTVASTHAVEAFDQAGNALDVIVRWSDGRESTIHVVCPSYGENVIDVGCRKLGTSADVAVYRPREA